MNKVASPVQCPICGRADSSQRVSAILGNGTRTSVTQQSFFSAWANNRNNGGWVIPQKYTTSSTSGTADRLAPPGYPVLPLDKTFWTSVAISAGLAFILNTSNPILPMIMSGLVGGAAWYLFQMFQNRDRLAQVRQMHQGRLAQYYESYYCKRDDVCFMPGVHHAQPELYKAWLFQYN